MALSQRDYRRQRIEKLEREIDELRDRYWLEPPGENRRRIRAARDAKLAEIDELNQKTPVKRPGVPKAAYTVAVVFVMCGLVAENYSTFVFGVFALLVGLFWSYRNDLK